MLLSLLNKLYKKEYKSTYDSDGLVTFLETPNNDVIKHLKKKVENDKDLKVPFIWTYDIADKYINFYNHNDDSINFNNINNNNKFHSSEILMEHEFKRKYPNINLDNKLKEIKSSINNTDMDNGTLLEKELYICII